MKMRAFWMLGLALLLAGGSVFLARNWLESQVKPVVIAQPKPEIEVAKVVVAGAPLRFGNAIRREHLRLIEWPAKALPEGAFTSIEQVLDGENDRYALRPIEVNEPVLSSKISGPGQRAILSSIIDKDMRAMTIRVNDVVGVAGFVLPGDHVDIMLTRKKSGQLITDIFLQRVKVLGIGSDANDTRTKPGVTKNVTFEVTPTQVQKLILAQKVGSLSLSLRNMTNANAVEPKRVTMRDLEYFEANLPEEVEEPTVFASEDILEPAPQPEPKTVAAVVEKPRQVVKSVAVVKKKDPLSAVRIVRALKASSVEVPKEKGGAFSNLRSVQSTSSSGSSSAGSNTSAFEPVNLAE